MAHFVSSKALIIWTWCLIQAAILWIVAPTISLVATVAMCAIGLASVTVMFVFTKPPEQTMAEAIRAVVTKKTR